MKNLFYKIKSKIIAVLSDVRVYKGGFILFGDSSYKIKGPHMRRILSLIRPGDVLLRRYSNYLGSVTIPGYFSHAAILVDTCNVVHMLGDGVTKEDILTFMRCDDLMILRIKDDSKVNSAIAMVYDILYRGIKYDYNFDNLPKRMYCTELVDVCYGNIIRKKIGNNKVITPDALIDHDFYDVIWEK